MAKKKLTAQEFARMGGKATLAKHGKDHFSKLAKARWARRVRIQPQEQKNFQLPYPYFIDRDGNVGRQEFWKGEPERLLGFSSVPRAGDIDILFKEFWKEPELAVGMYPVFANKGDNWVTSTIAIASVDVLK